MPLSTPVILGALILMLLLSGCQGSPAVSMEEIEKQVAAIEQQVEPQPNLPFWKQGHKATIVRVIDGDTVVLDFEADIKTATARLIGFNTPEVKSPHTSEQCFGPQASARMKMLASQNPDVYVLTDVDPIDIYGRLLVYLFDQSNGEFINKTMLEEGYAQILNIPPNNTFEREFKIAESKARLNNLGLWEACKGYN